MANDRQPQTIDICGSLLAPQCGQTADGRHRLAVGAWRLPARRLPVRRLLSKPVLPPADET